MGLLIAGFERDAWAPFVLKGLQRHVDAEGDRKLRRERGRILQFIRGDQDTRDMVVTLAVLQMDAEGEPPAPTSGGRFVDGLLRVLDWIAAHKEFFEWIISLFAGAALAPAADWDAMFAGVPVAPAGAAAWPSVDVGLITQIAEAVEAARQAGERLFELVKQAAATVPGLRTS